jgi:ribonuclease H2 subunit C
MKEKIINLNLKKKINKNEKHRIQKLPFKINHEGKANIEKYFNEIIKTENNNEYTSSFRGRPLRGKEIIIPETLIGVICKEERDKKEEDVKYYKTETTFENFTNWCLDSNPDNDTSIINSIKYIQIQSEFIHKELIYDHDEEVRKIIEFKNIE